MAEPIPMIPTNAPKPKKKASAAAREAEAEDGFVIVEHRGITLRVPVGGKIPIAAIDAFRADDNYEGTKQMLGPDQWQRLSDSGTTAEELNEVAKKVQEASGNS